MNALGAFFLIFALSSSAFAQSVQSKVENFPWQRSGKFSIAEIATIQLPANTKALQPAQAGKFLELLGNLPSDNYYLVSADDYSWFAVFSFNPSGYVKDNERIEPDSLLDSLKEQNRRSEADRRKLGLKPLTLLGWQIPPHYDITTKRLEWGTKLSSEGEITINYTSRVLGRTGVIAATLVADPLFLERDVDNFHSLLRNLSFVGGQRYEEFRAGDKVAEYGLAALVVGGAAAVAVKTGSGLLKAAGFATLGLIAAAFAALKRIFAGRKQPE